MCGICGIYHFESGKPVAGECLQDMLAALQHRGPDDQGIHIDNELAIGMRRLSIIDLETGGQPISNEADDVVVVLNGEIYNYRELASDLRRRGHTLKTASDTEVIVHLYEEMGDDCVDSLRGMFAFALWDQRARRLLIARDRLGIKPLFYAQSAKQIVFGSEIKAILRHPDVEICRNLGAISDYLSLKYVPAPQTMFAGIRALPPGHLLICDRNGVRERMYWDLTFDHIDDRQPDEAFAEQLEHLLKESIELRLRSDVPFGAFLSGGVDSSLVVAMMSQVLNAPVKTFSVGFEHDGKKTDELPFARVVAAKFNTDHREVIVTPNDMIKLAETITWHLDQPIADQAMIAMYVVSELASRHVKMVLTGEGGDELFAGYARYVGDRLSPLFRYVPAPGKLLSLAVASRLPGLHRPKIALYALCQGDEANRFCNWFPLFNRDMKAGLLSAAATQELNGALTADLFAEHLSRTDAKHGLNRMLYVDTKLWLPDYLLARGDRMSMANSLEARVPLLDHKIVEFAASLPTNLKLNRTKRKYLLKKVARKYLPSGIVDRKKEGFPIPISEWFRNEARPFVRDLLAPATIRRRGLCDAQYVQTLLDAHDSRSADHGLLLWGLASLELWHQLYIDSPRSDRHKTPAALHLSNSIR